MMASLYNGVNGIKAQNFGIDLISDNISNVNTPGFKYSNSEFKDLFYSKAGSASSNPSQAGNGVFSAASKLVFDQGNLVSGESEFDVALQGKGFFGILGSDGLAYYTRNGSFLRDGNADLVDASGNYVLGTMNPSFSALQYNDRVASMMGNKLDTSFVDSGFTVDSEREFDIGTTGSQGKISVPKNLYMPPTTTTSVSWRGSIDAKIQSQIIQADIASDKISFSTNEDDKVIASGQLSTDDIASAKAGDRVIINFIDANGVRSSVETTLDENLAFQTNELDLPGLDRASLKIASASLATETQIAPVTTLQSEVVNSDGSKSILQYKLERVIPQVGDDIKYTVSASMLDTNKNLIAELGTGEMTFDKNGALTQNTLSSVNNPNGSSISVNLGTPLSGNIVGSGYNGIYISNNVATNQEIVTKADGYAEGFFSQYSITSDGSIVAEFDNGKTATIAKLALYNFINEEGLASVGGSNFMATSNSGEASFIVKDGKVVNTATFVGQKIEQSNVDLGTQLTDLIVIQKSFDASSKSITTSDEMIQKAINMKS